MDERQFDRLARVVGVAASRRIVLGSLAVGFLNVLPGFGMGDGEARRDHRNRGGRRRCGQQYAGCNNGDDCCRGLICKRLENPNSAADFTGTCAYRRGCGKRKDYCQKNRDCCRNFRCGGHQCKRR